MLAKKDFVSPPKLVAAAASLFGGEITLDPASSEHANSIVQAEKYFDWRNNGLKQEWKSKNIYLYPPRDVSLKSEQPKSDLLFTKISYFKKSNQKVWLETAYKKWLKREFNEGIILLTSSEVALISMQKIGIDLPMCILKEHPRLLEDNKKLKPIKHSKVFGFVFYMPPIQDYQTRIHDFHRQYSDLGRVYL